MGKYVGIITLNTNFNLLEDPIMENIIGKGISGREYFYFSWSYLYFSAGYFFCQKLYIPLHNEFNKLKFFADRKFLLV
jgi:hypothetical protein